MADTSQGPARGHKADWLIRCLRCLRCQAVGLCDAVTELVCDTCKQSYPRDGGAWRFLDEGIAEAAKVAGDVPVSDHLYNDSALRLIQEVEAIDGMALDCGAGARTFVCDRLVQVDIAPFSNIDVVAINQRLPFEDSCFDLVLSFDVLEHVTDPFAAASEIVRVLKPGGILYVDVPFLQIEHAYPHHYFNMTRHGLRELFVALSCEAHVVPDSGHPTHVVHTILHTFLAGMPKADRERFKLMTIGEILASSHKQLLTEFRAGFHEDVTWKMASTTQALFRKPGPRTVHVDLTELPQLRAGAASEWKS